MAASIRDYSGRRLTGNLDNDVSFFSEIFRNDAVFRKRRIKPAGCGASFAVMFFDGMVNSERLGDDIIKPLTRLDTGAACSITAHYVCERVLFAGEVSYKTDVGEMLGEILYGDFLESAMINLSLIRRKLVTPDLRIESLKTGVRSATSVYVCYLDSLTDKKILERLKSRLEKINIDGVLDSNYLTEYIRDSKTSIFKTVGTTERPDIVAARLLEGRVAVVVEGTPMVLTLPYLFSENFQSDEDYYLSYLVSSVRRFLRYLCFAAAVCVPAVFIALTTFHIELMPTHFAVSVAKLRMGVPISSVGECLLLVVVFEVLKEAGVRMSQSLGHALSIVGGLVVGQAAVEAKIISAPMLIAVAFSGICGLMVPRLKTSVLYIRISSVAVCALFGLYGFMALCSLVIIHILNLESFGVDYTVSLRRIGFQSLKDTAVRASWPKMLYRPLFNRNLKRAGGKRP